MLEYRCERRTVGEQNQQIKGYKLYDQLTNSMKLSKTKRIFEGIFYITTQFSMEYIFLESK